MKFTKKERKKSLRKVKSEKPKVLRHSSSVEKWKAKSEKLHFKGIKLIAEVIFSNFKVESYEAKAEANIIWLSTDSLHSAVTKKSRLLLRTWYHCTIYSSLHHGRRTWRAFRFSLRFLVAFASCRAAFVCVRKSATLCMCVTCVCSVLCVVFRLYIIIWCGASISPQSLPYGCTVLVARTCVRPSRITRRQIIFLLKKNYKFVENSRKTRTENPTKSTLYRSRNEVFVRWCVFGDFESIFYAHFF